MKIHLTGTEWHGATTFNLERAFKDLGHEVLFFDKHPKKRDRVLKNIAVRLSRKPYGVEQIFNERRSKEWLKSVQEYAPDLIFIEDAPYLSIDCILKAKELKKPIFYYLTSPPYGSGAREQLFALQYVDELFCIDEEWSKIAAQFYPPSQKEGNPSKLEERSGVASEGLRAKPIHHLPLAASPKDFFPIAGAEKKYDVAYIASVPEQSPDGLMRANLVNQIPEKYSVVASGSGWNYWLKYFPSLASRIQSSSSIPISKMNEVFNESKIVINFHSTGHTASISARTFEVALAGGFQIADYRKDLDKLVPPNLIPIFGNLKEMNELIAHWSSPAHEKERQEKSQKLRDHVLAHHTWEHRAKEVLKIYEGGRK